MAASRLKGMLIDRGNAHANGSTFGSGSIEVPAPGFNRFFDETTHRKESKLWLSLSSSAPRRAIGGNDTLRRPSIAGEPIAWHRLSPACALPTDWIDPAYAGTTPDPCRIHERPPQYTSYQPIASIASTTHAWRKVDKLKASVAAPAPPSLRRRSTATGRPDFDSHQIVRIVQRTIRDLASRALLVIDFTFPSSSPSDQLITSPAQQTAKGRD